MRRLLPVLSLLSPCLAGESAPESTAATSGSGDSVSDIPIGIEVVTGYRSEYIHRGFKLADDLIDVQAEVEIALSNEWVLSLGGYYGTATGDEDFSEGAGFLDLKYDTAQWTAGLAMTYRDYQDSFFEDGFDLNPGFTWHLNDDWDLGAGVAYDTGDGGWYGNLEAAWAKPTGKDSFLSAKAGTSLTSDYYGSDGWHDIYARVSWTYAFNKSVAVTPFLGTSIPMESSPETDRLFGGVWFEVSF
jgi:hypothetical protein